MKLFLIALTSLLSTSAFAFPRVGDTVTYSGTSTTSGVTQPMSATMTLLSINASDPQNLRYEVQMQMVVGTKVDTQTDTLEADEFLTEETGAMIVVNCVAGGGTLETVTTVPTGPIQTCKIVDGQTTTWIGDVPFAYVKVIEAGRNGIDVTMTSYARGP